jgi:hypothetical protein
MMERSEDLPAPEGPMMERKSPLEAVPLISLRRSLLYFGFRRFIFFQERV